MEKHDPLHRIKLDEEEELLLMAYMKANDAKQEMCRSLIVDVATT